MSDSRLQTANLKRSYVGQQKRQSGVALFISLVMLLILTVLGLSSVQTTSVQERMARNARDTNLAFQAAESALKDAEALIETFNSLACLRAPVRMMQGIISKVIMTEQPIGATETG